MEVNDKCIIDRKIYPNFPTQYTHREVVTIIEITLGRYNDDILYRCINDNNVKQIIPEGMLIPKEKFLKASKEKNIKAKL